MVPSGMLCRTKAAAFCANLLAVEAALWTFVRKEGVEPTNNHIERLLPQMHVLLMPSEMESFGLAVHRRQVGPSR